MPASKKAKLPPGLYPVVPQPTGLEQVEAIFFEPVDGQTAKVMCPECGSSTLMGKGNVSGDMVQLEFNCSKNSDHVIHFVLGNMEPNINEPVGGIRITMRR